jgi:cyclophilin family peptidyl-prolyl cis-trans isomerase
VTLEPTETTAGEPAAFTYGSGACPPSEKPATVPESFSDAPRDCTDDSVDYGAVVETSEGSFTIDLLEGAAPGTVNSFVVLARWGWFDGVQFHRVVPGFVNQTGDRTGNPPGTGGPGYLIADELPDSLDEYVPGAVAMANSGPDTNGSQWFTCVDCSVLPSPNYSLFGQVVDGMDVVQAINALGQGDGPPSKEVTITSVTITENGS